LTYTSQQQEQIVTITGDAYNYPELYPFIASISMAVTNEDGNLSGSLNYYYSRNRLDLTSTAITEISASGTQGTIKGTCRVNGKDDYSFEAQISDNNPDKFRITIRDEAGTIFFTAPLKEIDGGDLKITILGLAKKAGDYDGDGDVDGSDLKAFAAAYAQRGSIADLNDDSSVNSADVSYFANRFGILPNAGTQGAMQSFPTESGAREVFQSQETIDEDGSLNKKPSNNKRKNNKKKHRGNKRKDRKN